MTLKEKLLEVFTEEEIADLVLKEGVSLDMEIKNTTIENHEDWNILFEDGNRNICKIYGHNWETIWQIKGSGMRRCKVCLKQEFMKFYIWED